MCYQEEISTIFRNHSREARKKGRVSQSMTNTPSSSTSIKHEIGNMLEEFKSEMLHTFSLQMDTMQVKRKQEEVERSLAILSPRCTRKHPRNECPLNFIEVFLLCEENHDTKSVPPYLELKLYTRVGEKCQSNYVSSTREGLKALGHINKVCKVHLTLTIKTIRMHLRNLGTPPLFHPGLHLLLGLTTLHIILNL